MSFNFSPIVSGIFTKQLLLRELFDFLKEKYHFSNPSIIKRIEPFLDHLNDGLYYLVEYPYVDKFYRDSYYNYYSTKNRTYNRECIRISIFKTQIEHIHFRSANHFNLLRENFSGYFIIRPTNPNIIGRSWINPKIIKSKNFSCCSASCNLCINGIKLSIEGFPYSSQDTETISCAETTIWSIMEYFGHKYPEYKPVLPSKILSCLANSSYERQLPSNGLVATQISYALKEFGFGVKLYHEMEFSKELLELLFTYIESGIPFVATLQNEKIAHAIVIIGQENIDFTELKNLKASCNDEETEIFYDYALLPRKFIVIDDNFPPYQKASFANPTEYYTNKKFDNCRISTIIVPLYPKIYVDAYRAKGLISQILSNRELLIFFDNKPFLRIFLTSSRSFKFFITQTECFDLNLKELIIETIMPKFIWIAELSNIELLNERKANGLIVLDATEANRDALDSLLFIISNNHLVRFGENGFSATKISLIPFSMYTNNLKGEF